MKTPHYEINRGVNNIYLHIDDKKNLCELADTITDINPFQVVEARQKWGINNGTIVIYCYDDKKNWETIHAEISALVEQFYLYK